MDLRRRYRHPPTRTAPAEADRLTQEIDAVLEPLRPHDPGAAAAVGLLLASLPVLILVVAVFL